MIEVGVVYGSLMLARIAAFVAVLPLLGGQQAPRMVKVGLTMALTAFWSVSFIEQMPACAWLTRDGTVPWLGYGVALGREALLGIVVGYAFGLFLLPARIAGEYLSQEMGLSFSNMVNATGDGTGTPLTIAFEMMAGALFLGLDGHHLFFGAMHGLFEQYPVGGTLPSVPVERMIGETALASEWGLMLAAPVGVCLFLTTLVLLLLTRTAPQLNLFTVGFPLRLGVGLAATILLLPNGISTLVSILEHCGEMILTF